MSVENSHQAWHSAIYGGSAVLHDMYQEDPSLADNDFLRFIYLSALEQETPALGTILIKQLASEGIRTYEHMMKCLSLLSGNGWKNSSRRGAFLGKCLVRYQDQLKRQAEEDEATLKRLFLKKLGIDPTRAYDETKKVMAVIDGSDLGKKIVREALHFEQSFNNS